MDKIKSERKYVNKKFFFIETLPKMKMLSSKKYTKILVLGT